ncbi:hypothetical protein OAB94_02395, partial [Flavobacteriaceae bacterium]|nr:hypothetical protein [Flavobacteriaceae bacterium]
MKSLQFFPSQTTKTTGPSVSATLRSAIWDMYAGPNKTSMKCLLCGRVEICRIRIKEWEAAHIVARVYHKNKPRRYDLIPSCAPCNNQCSDVCVFDYLIGRERYNVLRKMIRVIYQAFKEENPNVFK